MFKTDYFLISFQQVSGVQDKLLDLFVSPAMSFSLKLQIIQSLDQTTRLVAGMQWFLGQHKLQTGATSEVKVESTTDSGKDTCYQRVLNIMMTKQV